MTQRAIIIDLDGTLYDSRGRKHYVESEEPNYEKFHKASSFDRPNWWCVEIIKRFVNDHTILYVSGREEKHRSITLDWLGKYELPLNPEAKLFMRGQGDHRKDAIIKKEIYETIIKLRYDILFCVDDRKQCVEMWRSEGVVVLQCSEGDF